MSDFLDRVVARAGRGGTSLRPRVAHRFGPPEYHIVSALDGQAAPGGQDDEDPSTDAGRGASLEEPPSTAVAPVSLSERAPISAPVDPAAVTIGLSLPVEQEHAARLPPASPRVLEVGPALASGRSSDPDERDAAAADGFVERLRARLRDSRSERPPAPPDREQPDAAPPPPVRADRPAGPRAEVSDAAPARSSRAAGNEADFWSFLYGPQPEPPVRPEPVTEGARAPAPERGPARPSSRLDERAVARITAPPAMSGSTPAATTTITIGRIEVRAMTPAVAPRQAAAPARRPPRLGLADYMRQTAPGARRR